MSISPVNTTKNNVSFTNGSKNTISPSNLDKTNDVAMYGTGTYGSNYYGSATELSFINVTKN